MSRPGEHWPSAAVRLRSLVDRFALGLLVGLSVLLLLLGKADIKLVGLVGGRLTDGVAPALAVLNRPVLAVRSTFDGIANILAVYEENGRLREESRRLRGWQAEAARLGVENRSLRRMLAVPSVEPSPAWLTGRVVGDSGGVFVEALLVDAGAEQGVAVGMPATTPEGLVGRVITVGWSSFGRAFCPRHSWSPVCAGCWHRL
jgi:rod shape-determining protein MreC